VRALVALVLLVTTVSASATVRVGDRLPDFALVDFTGKPVGRASLAGTFVVIDFWATWCIPCRTALPALDAMARRWRERGVVVLAVNVDRTRAAADAWLAGRLPDPAMRLVHDPEGTLLAEFGASGMPAAYVIDRDGTVRFAAGGYPADGTDAIERAIDALLAPVTP
jgi:thiol-disulfide isomerase/thioredoxin